MAVLSLSPRASAAFLKSLTELREREQLSLVRVSQILGCCRRTAWELLRPGCAVRVRQKYADKLGRYLGVPDFAPWQSSNDFKNGLRAIRDAWKKATEPADRRRTAWRLAIFVSEVALCTYKVASTSTLTVNPMRNPAALDILMTPLGTQLSGRIRFEFDTRKREVIHMSYTNVQGQRGYNGHLTTFSLHRILTQVRSWQKVTL